MTNRSSPISKQRGIASVEFAIAGLTTLLVLFGAIEMGRMMFTMNTLAEATRRGARVAAVCQVGVDATRIAQIAVFNSAGGGSESPVLNNLTTDNVVVEYLNAAGGVIGDAAGSGYTQIRYVRVRVVNYQYRFIVPGVDIVFTAPQFPTTIPRESLGVPKPDQTSTCA